MKRTLLHTASFRRSVKRLIKKQGQAAAKLRDTLRRLERDAFDPLLRTHKLKGYVDDAWSCTCDYDLRIVFCFVEHKGAEAISLLAIGTHDEVY